MKTLLYKQIRLAAHPMTLVFPASGAMLLIPSYPYTVAFFYVTLGIFFMFQNMREQRDNIFSAILPVRKRDTVKSTVTFVVILEVLSIAIGGCFMILSQTLFPLRDNLAGIDSNPALLSLVFLLFSAFNVIFLPAFYKNGYKVGLAFLLSNIATIFVLALDIILPHIFPWLDGYHPKQFILLGACTLIYGIITWLSYRKSAKLYEKVDL